MTMPFCRMYVDIPTETKDKLVKRAQELGMSQKALVAQLIEKECEPPKRKPATKKRKKRSSKRG